MQRAYSSSPRCTPSASVFSPLEVSVCLSSLLMPLGGSGPWSLPRSWLLWEQEPPGKAWGRRSII